MQLAGEVKSLHEEITTTRKQLASAHEEISELKKQHETSSDQQQQSIDALTGEIKSISDGIGRLEREQKKREEQSFWSRLFGR